MQTRQKNILAFFSFFLFSFFGLRERNFYLSQIFTTIYFIRKNSYFMQTRQTNITFFFSFFSGKGIFTYYKFSHLTTIFFIRKNSYFSDIRFLQCADFGKSLGKIFNIVMKPIWVRALRLIFSQVYITRPCLQFYRPPKFSRIFCFWEFRISDFRFASFTGQILAWTEKIWNTKFSKRKKSRNFGRPAEL